MMPSRRRLLALAAAAPLARARAEESRPQVVAFANVADDPGTRIEGTGFTGADVRESFSLAARRKPIDLIFYDNALDRATALANARDAVAREADVFIQYGWDESVNGDVGHVLAGAEIPALAVGQPMAGAPLYAADNAAAGRIAGEALARHAAANWPDRSVLAVIIGPPNDPAGRLAERARAIAASLKPAADPARLDTQGNPQKAEALLRTFLGAHAGQKVLVAALDDATALAAKAAVGGANRSADVVVVGQGCDHSVHGNASDKRELDPVNRGSILLGSVGFFLDRYGYDILPLAMNLAARRPVAALTTTQHRLVTPANAFVIYPPSDIN